MYMRRPNTGTSSPIESHFQESTSEQYNIFLNAGPNPVWRANEGNSKFDAGTSRM